jgi:hypothetical protein
MLVHLLSTDMPASSTITQELLGWKPTHPGLIEDIEQGHYFIRSAPGSRRHNNPAVRAREPDVGCDDTAPSWHCGGQPVFGYCRRAPVGQWIEHLTSDCSDECPVRHAWPGMHFEPNQML